MDMKCGGIKKCIQSILNKFNRLKMRKLEDFKKTDFTFHLEKNELVSVNGGKLEDTSFYHCHEQTCVNGCSDGHWEIWRDGVCVFTTTSPPSDFADCHI